eukprot:scaffold5966_cov67-Phaeocystis_antarctica.AAC.3
MEQLGERATQEVGALVGRPAGVVQSERLGVVGARRRVELVHVQAGALTQEERLGGVAGVGELNAQRGADQVRAHLLCTPRELGRALQRLPGLQARRRRRHPTLLGQDRFVVVLGQPIHHLGGLSERHVPRDAGAEGVRSNGHARRRRRADVRQQKHQRSSLFRRKARQGGW